MTVEEIHALHRLEYCLLLIDICYEKKPSSSKISAKASNVSMVYPISARKKNPTNYRSERKYICPLSPVVKVHPESTNLSDNVKRYKRKRKNYDTEIKRGKKAEDNYTMQGPRLSHLTVT